MRLSEAIREGARLHRQTRGEYLNFHGEEPLTCALGAAFEALTGLLPFEVLEDHYDVERLHQAGVAAMLALGGDTVCDLIAERCAVPEDVLVPLPHGTPSRWSSGTPSRWSSTVIHLNDTLGWPREQIAAYLEQHGL